VSITNVNYMYLVTVISANTTSLPLTTVVDKLLRYFTVFILSVFKSWVLRQ